MRRLLVGAYLANLALDAASLALLPDRVAIHFGAHGIPDNWASKGTNVLLLSGLHTVLFAVLYLVPRLAAVVPARWVNLPYRDYWLAEPRRGETLRRIGDYSWELGAAVFGFQFWAGALTLAANLSEPVRLHVPLFLGGLGLLLGYTAWWCVRFYRTFRRPPLEAP